jgi:2-(1,2-epoxy-1,2-dihydrophenyl)acetyl-CoA isomerase
MDKPVVAAVHGPAVGIGLSLALACDLVVAARSAYFMLAFVNIGLVPDGGASAFVASRVGIARAAEMAMLGEPVPAPRALDWGLINAVHADDEFDAAVAALLARLAGGPTASYAGAKRELERWFYADLGGQLEFEAGLQQQMAATDDFLEGVAAFVEKRPARFAGS